MGNGGGAGGRVGRLCEAEELGGGFAGGLGVSIVVEEAGGEVDEGLGGCGCGGGGDDGGATLGGRGEAGEARLERGRLDEVEHGVEGDAVTGGERRDGERGIDVVGENGELLRGVDGRTGSCARRRAKLRRPCVRVGRVGVGRVDVGLGVNEISDAVVHVFPPCVTWCARGGDGTRGSWGRGADVRARVGDEHAGLGTGQWHM